MAALLTLQRHNRLALRQASWTVGIAFVLGLLFSIAQLVSDFKAEASRLQQVTTQFLEILDQPASLAAYQKDADYARSLVVGYFSYEPVYRAEIRDAQDQVLAQEIGTLVQGPYRKWVNLLFGETQRFEKKLTYQLPPQEVMQMIRMAEAGRLVVEVDTYSTGAAFIDRGIQVMVFGLARNFVLAIVLLVVFHFFLTKPFVTLVDQLSLINPANPEQTVIQGVAGHEKDEFFLLVTAVNRMLRAIEDNLEKRLTQAQEAMRLQTELVERQKREEEMKRYQVQLEHSNVELEQLLRELQNTQEALIESKTLSSLGGLVAGVAHELNTPIGVAVSSSSFLLNRTEELQQKYQSQAMTEEDFTKFLGGILEMSSILSSNLERASLLVQSFKKTAVDQAHFQLEPFLLGEYIQMTLKSLEPETKPRGVQVQVDCPAELEITSYPGAVSQIIVNLVQNVLTHAYEPNQGGKVLIQVRRKSGEVEIHFTDFGKGIPFANQGKVFEPFFTTSSGRGGSGLGLNIVYNLVKQKLKGDLRLESEPGHGTKFLIRLPAVLQAEASETET